MAEKLETFALENFYEAIDATRVARGLAWKDVAAESGVSASTLTRMAQGRRPDVDSLAALAAWSDLDTNDFLKPNAKRKSEPLARISTYLKSDRHLTAANANALDQVIRALYEQFRESKPAR
jgi:transcriptional regulator with XRE-family HTH domain